MPHDIRWTVEKIAQRLTLIEPLVYRRRAPLAPFRYQTLPGPAAPPPVAPEVDDRLWPVILPDTYWGRPETDFVMRSTFQVPADWEAGPVLALCLPLGDARDFCHPEALVYVDGLPYIGCDRRHWEIRLRPEWHDGRPHTLALHGWTGLSGPGSTDPVTRLVMRQCEIVQIDSPAREFAITARVALGAAKALDANSPARGLLLNALDAAFGLLDLREPFGAAFYASIAPAIASLEAGIAQAGPALPVRLAATGHAHIDVAWLWTLDQTRLKAGRTFHTVLRLMEQFPDYHFTQSQPQLYECVRRDYPDVFEGIKSRVAEGRWEPLGGMWVEADCNITGAESLARQFLLGRTFFRQHFGPAAESPVLWLPDVFGYAWALPQLIKQAGLDYFFTTKLSWNQYNRLPYDSFWWQGLDGTRVLTHFSTASETESGFLTTYNAAPDPDQVLRTWNKLQQKELHSEVFMAFGYGDGGGGPTREMLENLRALVAFPALPQARQRPAGDFFRDLEQSAGPRLPVWDAELYLELHRGTYTTQSRNKRANRQTEFRLHDAEFLAAFAAQVDHAFRYPAEAFTEAWRRVCLNQFHDVLPGSGIGAIYAESLAAYSEVGHVAADIQNSALRALAGHVAGDLLLVNPTGFARHDLAFYPAQLPGATGVALADGRPVLIQASGEGTWLDAGELPPFSVTGIFFSSEPSAATSRPLTVTPGLMENDFVRIELDAAGDISRIYDKVQAREVLPAGSVANQFQAFEDRPKEWEAWDIDIFYDDKRWLAEPAESIRVVEAGPLRATLEVRRRILHSTYTQRLSLCHNSPRFDIETVIDWRERHVLLKAAFPVDILSPVATYEIQWGNVQRPTHRNTSWDWARFETCAQKWVDLSEGGYGVSLLNDCKYGHDVQGNVLRLSLLRSPTYPDPEADQGEQRFTYSLWPHAGGWGEGGTIPEAYSLNDPLLMFDAPRQAGGARALPGTRALPSMPPLVQCNAPNIVVETIKQAEDGQGLIVRLYESHRRRGEVTLTASFPLAAAYRTNLLEENQAPLTPKGRQVPFRVKPYEIVTLRLTGGRP